LGDANLGKAAMVTSASDGVDFKTNITETGGGTSRDKGRHRSPSTHRTTALPTHKQQNRRTDHLLEAGHQAASLPG